MANLHFRFHGREIGLPLVFSGGFHNYLRTVQLLPHIHPQGIEITYVLKGDACWLLENGTELFLSGGSLAVIQPHVRHHGQGNIIRPCWLFWFVLDLESADCLSDTPFLPADQVELQKIFREAGNCVRCAPVHYAAYAERLIVQLSQLATADFLEKAALRHTLCQMVMAATEVFRGGSGIAKRRGTLAGNAEKIMRMNMECKPSVAAIAQKLGLSATGFIKRFKHETGLTPADFFQRIKIEEARRRLSRSSASVTTIAFDMGFSSSQHFATVFKKYTGMTPREARHNSTRQQEAKLKA